MSTLTSSPPLSPPSSPPSPPRSAVIVQQGDTAGEVTIPGWVTDLSTYRRWAHSEAYPERGWLSFLDGEIWVDLSMEEILTHNRVKGAYSHAVMGILDADPRGSYVHDRVLLTNAGANLSTEPDGLFYLWATMQSGKLRMVPGKDAGYVELEGTPDMTLEVVSKSSRRKDNEILRELYWKAGVTEYWLVDARTEPLRFEILVHTSAGYQSTVATDDGWLRSDLLGREFRLVKGADPLGHASFVVQVR